MIFRWWPIICDVKGSFILERTRKQFFFFDLLPLTHHCCINTLIGNNATDRKRPRFRSNINAPLHYESACECQRRNVIFKFMVSVRGLNGNAVIPLCVKHETCHGGMRGLTQGPFEG